MEFRKRRKGSTILSRTTITATRPTSSDDGAASGTIIVLASVKCTFNQISSLLAFSMTGARKERKTLLACEHIAHTPKWGWQRKCVNVQITGEMGERVDR